ncbi:hypothetical protein [Vibrio panuliri]|uniref:Uncharacterized protein n=1 Tax=Vibrio panuliri TaxID=1381081 RepID=A0ABX3F6N0_9VIBR|nr:hypothetical protein [Vibrio panuliri]KAB1457268.1 hypothetical protein F7O85_05870 [Vibrio panuliri]OLQ85966.1 hypothetical protein BIY20_15720 [Vibrio panuliri]
MGITKREFEILKRRIDTISDNQLKELKTLIDAKLTRDSSCNITSEEVDFLLEIFSPTDVN